MTPTCWRKRHPAESWDALAETERGPAVPACDEADAGAYEAVSAFVADGVHCPRKMLINSDTHLLDQPDPAALDNVNTPDDLVGSVLEAAS